MRHGEIAVRPFAGGITLVTSDAFSSDKRAHMRSLVATVVELPSDGGRTTRDLI